MAAHKRDRSVRPDVELGDEDPLYSRELTAGPPDRRRVSLRWLGGAMLTGFFSIALIGGALQAAVGVDEHLIVRPASANTFGQTTSIAEKGDRFRPVPESRLTRHVIQISTVTRVDDRDIVRVRPFAHVHTTLAAPVAEDVATAIPAFRPADLFLVGDDDEQQPDAASSDSVYGAEVDGEVSIKTIDFPLLDADYDPAAELDLAAVAETVRAAAPFLTVGAVEITSSPFVDPARFDLAGTGSPALNALAVAITQENVSFLEKADTSDDFNIEDKVVTVDEGDSLRSLLVDQGADPAAATAIQAALVANFSFDFRAGQKLRVGLAPDPDTGSVRPVRVSLYQPDDSHVATVALSDSGTYVQAHEPILAAGLEEEERTSPQPTVLPTIYDGLWGTALSLGMSEDLIKTLVHIFSYDVDYQQRLAPQDDLDVVYSADGDTERTEILYAALTLSGVTHRFYRFRDASDGSVDFYNEEGKSAQKFLVRKPVAEGHFTSGFGMRRHPILKTMRMHTGIDWGAPTGTPVLAAGDGTVERIGTRSGYGRSITLQHLHGYETTYNHMSGYARGLEAGDHVVQGQVIGYVGSTGLSTGPHLHFEVLVNGHFVDPLKIRVPRGRELQGVSLATFEQERDRIDALLLRDDSQYASAD